MSEQKYPDQYQPLSPSHDTIPSPIEVLVHNWLGSGQRLSVEIRDLPSIPSPTDFPTVRGTINAGVPGTYDISYSLPATQWDAQGYFGARSSVGNVTFNLSGHLTINNNGTYSLTGNLTATDDFENYNPSSHREGFGELLTTLGRALVESKVSFGAVGIGLYNMAAVAYGFPLTGLKHQDFYIEFLGNIKFSMTGAIKDFPAKGDYDFSNLPLLRRKHSCCE